MYYKLTALVTLLSLVLYFILTYKVGQARGKFGVSAPATTGNADFERVFRVQQNTLESLMMHLPALWMFAYYVSNRYAAAIGAVWIVGRVLYARSYYTDAKQRGTGFIISIGSTGILLLGALIAVSLGLYRSI